METPEIQFRNRNPGIVVVENFLVDPMTHREFALQLNYEKRGSYGLRSASYPYPEYRVAFEKILGREITGWGSEVNGCYQYCDRHQEIVYHVDNQQYAAVLYLTPDAPPSGGTSFWRSKHSGKRIFDGKEPELTFGEGGAYLKDSTHWELVDQVGNVFNRLVIWYGNYIHSASGYFGDDVHDSRLFQIFFFDCENS